MPLKSGVLLVAALLNLSLGFIVFLRQPKRVANCTFGAFALALSGWCLTNSLTKMGIGVKGGFMVGKFAFALGSLVPCTFFAFALVFPGDRVDAPTRRWFTAIYLMGVVFAFLSFTPFILKGVVLRPWGLAPIYGVGYPLAILYVITFLGLGVVILAKKLVRSSSGYQRLQLKYLFLGLGIFGIAVLLFSAISTLILGTNQLVYLGPLSTVPMVAFISYAIVRYRLMEIGIVFQRGLVYLGIVLILSTLFVLLDYTISCLLPSSSHLVWDLPAFLLLILLLAPLKERVEATVGYLLPWGRRNHQEVLREFSRKLTALLDLRSLQRLIVETMVEVMQAKHASLWLLEEGQGDRYRPVAAYPNRRLQAAGLAVHHPLCQKLKEARQVLVKEELARQLEPGDLERLEEGFALTAASLLVPLFSRGDLHGLLALAEKRSRKVYSDQEIQFLTTVSYQATIALENAALYHQILVARDHYGMLLRHMDSGVIAVDRTGKITTFNPKAAEILRIRQKEAVGQKASFLGKELAGPLNRVLRGQGYSQQEGWLTLPAFSEGSPGDLLKGPPGARRVGGEEEDPTGRRRLFLSMSSSPLRDWNGGKVGALLVFSDLTEKKQLEEEVQHAQKMASLGMMAARLAHEIRNPLVAVKTFCQLLPERHRDTAFIDSFSSLVGKEVNRINSIVEQLLDLSRRAPLILRPVALHRVLGETLALLQNEFLERGIQKVCRFHPEEILVLGEEEKLKQLFLNLLLNSLQAIEGAGVIMVSTEIRSQADPAAPSAAHRSPPEENGKGAPWEAWIQIADTGRGILPEHLPYLFDPFFTTKEKGSGLGLSICQEIVKEFKGEIRIGSETGKGAVVTLRLPLSLTGVEDRE
ncbi:MAG: GAF domain-containing protein [Candidatus Tectomicrobia bacterium]|uniref:histidine kinase n=1 Tax=Tectimicrobiota bacterium TaxID=2528274 RepID=A0A932CPU7_UNCTE|nr:GAF domain-containing protein [Candidatus Tectomicrobia bacterium]